MFNIVVLISLPIILALFLISPNRLKKSKITFIGVSILALLSFVSYFSGSSPFSFFYPLHILFFILDIILLLFFFYRGVVEKDSKVYALAFTQLILYGIYSFLEPSQISYDILVDKISLTMLLVINIVGGIIIIYALKYIESEEFSEAKKNGFIAILFFFLAVMNLIVTTNSLEIFFLCFELTTLCSYLLIRYRGDKNSKTNALRALWMNQIGGVAILAVMILSANYYDTSYMNILLKNIDETHVFILAIFAIAAFVKGAAIPFEKWLLGAMVAPTPVSAILHSATMVKISPYLILKLTPAFTPFVSSLIVFLGMFIFMSASIMALSKDYFKEVLGLSTIALLAFMVAIASIGSDDAINIALVLIVFHAISKALLFLQAGILEKEFHLKYLSDMNFLVDKSPLLVFMILVGFTSLTLPPFGVFIGKFLSIELMIEQIKINPLNIIAFIFMVIGSVVLTLLYFKVATKMMANENISLPNKVIKIDTIYKYTSLSLFVLLMIGVVSSFTFSAFSFYEIVLPIFFIFIVPLILYKMRSKKVNLVKEYNCGEKDKVVVNTYYFELSDGKIKLIKYLSIFCMVFLVLGSLI